MDRKPVRRKPSKSEVTAPSEVDRFIASLNHPFKEEILILRQFILATDPSIAEAIKWNAPSFRTSEFFATFHLGAKDGVQIILHFGAKKREKTTARTSIADPEALLNWLSDDRASIKMHDTDEIHAARTAFLDIIRQWIQYL
jgi:hypothetical protein